MHELRPRCPGRFRRKQALCREPGSGLHSPAPPASDRCVPLKCYHVWRFPTAASLDAGGRGGVGLFLGGLSEFMERSQRQASSTPGCAPHPRPLGCQTALCETLAQGLTGVIEPTPLLRKNLFLHPRKVATPSRAPDPPPSIPSCWRILPQEGASEDTGVPRHRSGHTTG